MMFLLECKEFDKTINGPFLIVSCTRADSSTKSFKTDKCDETLALRIKSSLRCWSEKIRKKSYRPWQD